MKNAEPAIRIRPGNPNHHLPSSPRCGGATPRQDDDGLPRLAIRTSGYNINHHLWNNNGTWWCHYTLHLPDFTKRRVRASLETHSPQQARARRDVLLAGKSCLVRISEKG